MQSIWSKTCCMEERAALNRDIKTQTAVIGGGMAGVLTAWALSEAGVDTVVWRPARWAADRPRTPRPNSLPNTV